MQRCKGFDFGLGTGHGTLYRTFDWPFGSDDGQASRSVVRKGIITEPGQLLVPRIENVIWGDADALLILLSTSCGATPRATIVKKDNWNPQVIAFRSGSHGGREFDKVEAIRFVSPISHSSFKQGGEYRNFHRFHVRFYRLQTSPVAQEGRSLSELVGRVRFGPPHEDSIIRPSRQHGVTDVGLTSSGSRLAPTDTTKYFLTQANKLPVELVYYYRTPVWFEAFQKRLVEECCVGDINHGAVTATQSSTNGQAAVDEAPIEVGMGDADVEEALQVSPAQSSDTDNESIVDITPSKPPRAMPDSQQRDYVEMSTGSSNILTTGESRKKPIQIDRPSAIVEPEETTTELAARFKEPSVTLIGSATIPSQNQASASEDSDKQPGNKRRMACDNSVPNKTAKLAPRADGTAVSKTVASRTSSPTPAVSASAFAPRGMSEQFASVNARLRNIRAMRHALSADSPVPGSQSNNGAMNSILEGSHTLSSEQMEMAQRLQRTEIALGDAMLQLCERAVEGSRAELENLGLSVETSESLTAEADESDAAQGAGAKLPVDLMVDDTAAN